MKTEVGCTVQENCHYLTENLQLSLKTLCYTIFNHKQLIHITIECLVKFRMNKVYSVAVWPGLALGLPLTLVIKGEKFSLKIERI